MRPPSDRSWRRALAGAVGATLLAACGGGGGGDPPPPVTPGDSLPGIVVSGATPVAAGCTGGRTSGTVFGDAEAEPFVAISPLDPDHLVAAWQQDRASNGGARALVSATSFDGGRTWTRTMHPMSRCGGAATGAPGDQERASDPWVDFGPDGTVYLMGLSFSGTNFTPGSSSEMLVSRSVDGGRTWGPPQRLVIDGPSGFNDKNTLTADPTDARYVYAVWDRLDRFGNGPTLLARSTDGGATWEGAREIYQPVIDGGVSQTIGNRIVVLPEGAERGTLVNLFMQIDSVGNRVDTRVRVMRSTDKGVSWQDPVTVGNQQSLGTSDPLTGTRVRDGAIVPTIAVGPGNVLWAAWQDARINGGARDAIVVARSLDGGRSWSAPVAANRDPSVPAFTPTLHVRADGTLGLMHFDLRSDTPSSATLLGDLWLLTTRDGQTWTEAPLARGFDLALAPLVTGGHFVGDYHGLVSAGSTWLPLVVLPGRDTANRTDVRSLRAGAAASAATARAHAARTAAPTPALPADFDARHREAVRQALAARPGR